MERNINYIIREVSPEQCDFSFYFEDDGLTEAGGDYCYNLFIINYQRNSLGFNYKEYERVQNRANGIIDDYYYILHEEMGIHASVVEDNIKEEIMREVCRLHDISEDMWKPLLEWLEGADTSGNYSIAEFLTIDTGKTWSVGVARGYCQGDYVEVVYCEEHYTYESVKAYGEIWLGAGKEFSVTYLDDNKEEDYTVYGYIIADSQAWKDEDYKRLVCEWACIPEEKTKLEMIDGSRSYTSYTYRTV